MGLTNNIAEVRLVGGTFLFRAPTHQASDEFWEGAAIKLSRHTRHDFSPHRYKFLTSHALLLSFIFSPLPTSVIFISHIFYLTTPHLPSAAHILASLCILTTASPCLPHPKSSTSLITSSAPSACSSSRSPFSPAPSVPSSSLYSSLPSFSPAVCNRRGSRASGPVRERIFASTPHLASNL